VIGLTSVAIGNRGRLNPWAWANDCELAAEAIKPGADTSHGPGRKFGHPGH
jgi:hypothetical protein